MQVLLKQKDSRQLGGEGEALAAEFLSAKGYRIIAKNYRCRWGEVDLIVRKGNQIVFVEVKSRQSVDRVDPHEVISYPKQKRISKVAQYFLSRNKDSDIHAGFGVIIVDYSEDSPKIQWIEDAFWSHWGY